MSEYYGTFIDLNNRAAKLHVALAESERLNGSKGLKNSEHACMAEFLKEAWQEEKRRNMSFPDRKRLMRS